MTEAREERDERAATGSTPAPGDDGRGRRGGGVRPPRSVQLVETYFRLAPVTVPLYALLCAVVVGAVFMLLTGANPLTAYAALARGAFGGVDALANSLARATPFIGASLAVAFAFKAGLFNIGAEGQLFIGAVTAAWVGTWASVAGLPGAVAAPLVLLAGGLGGLLWGAVPGVLKARTGAHEVITTIMLNNIAVRLTEWLVSSREPLLLLDPGSSAPQTAPIAGGARLPVIVPSSRLHAGFLLGVLLCALVWWVLQRTTYGFTINAVGLNADAARYAGMSVAWTVVSVMALSGAFAGVAGAAEVQGGRGLLAPGVFRGIGFDSISIALLARANPVAVVPAAFLWGALLSGAPTMQMSAGLSIDLVRVLQALILLFVAADAIVRTLFRIRAPRGAADQPQVIAKGWGA